MPAPSKLIESLGGRRMRSAVGKRCRLQGRAPLFHCVLGFLRALVHAFAGVLYPFLHTLAGIFSSLVNLFARLFANMLANACCLTYYLPRVSSRCLCCLAYVLRSLANIGSDILRKSD